MSIKILDHTADLKFEVSGKKLEDIFKNSAKAMRNSIVEKKVKSKINKKISVKGKDYESLLYNFLEELLFLFDSEYFILKKVKKIEINKFKINAELIGDNSENYEITTHIKAITYNEMFVKEKKNKWLAQFVFDI